MNRLHVYTGDGKGKTTAAMGLAVRCLGHGRRVLIGQFMKDGRSGELLLLQGLPNAAVLLPPPLQGFFTAQSAAEQAAVRAEQAAYADALQAQLARLQPHLTVLDELNVALHLNVLTREAAETLIDAALRCGEVVCTGRSAPDWLLQRADYVSRIAAEKHPYASEGLPAREGIEW